MSRVWIAADTVAQSALLPVDVRDLLPADHLAFGIMMLVGELDLSGFEVAYRSDGRGRPPFAPRVMLALILYCRAKGLVSSRQVAAACYDDLGARVITGNHHPDRSTIDRFLSVHAAAVKGLLPQTLRLGHAEDLVDVSVVAGDGSTVAANAAMNATVTEAELLGQIADLEQHLATAQQAWTAQMGAETPTLLEGAEHTQATAAPAAADGTATTAWPRMHTVAGMLHERQDALAWLRAHPDSDLKDWQDRLDRDRRRVARCNQRLVQARAAAQAKHDRRTAAQAAGLKPRGRAPVPVEEHTHVRQARKALTIATARAQNTADNQPPAGRVNTTDPASMIMPSKHGGYDQNHNIQALAGKNQFVLAITTHPNPNDKQALTGLLQQGRAHLDTAGITDRIGVALFDAGYASEANFTADLPIDLLLVAVGKHTHPTGQQPEPATTIPTSWQPMADRLNTPENRELYKRRAAIIEPLFAQLFARFGRTLHLRGDHVDTELHLWATTHNLLKINRHRRRRGS